MAVPAAAAFWSCRAEIPFSPPPLPTRPLWAVQMRGLVLLLFLAGQEVLAVNSSLDASRPGVAHVPPAQAGRSDGGLAPTGPKPETEGVSAFVAAGVEMPAEPLRQVIRDENATGAIADFVGTPAGPRPLERGQALDDAQSSDAAWVSSNATLLRASSARRLAVTTEQDWTWPASTRLSIQGTDPAANTVIEQGQIAVAVVAGFVYNAIEIEIVDADNTFETADHPTPEIRLVGPGGVTRTQCSSTSINRPVGLIVSDPLYTAVMGMPSEPLGLDLNALKLFKSGIDLMFMLGGRYKLCYTPDGSFGSGGPGDGNADGTEHKNNLVPAEITVYGVYSPCADVGGLADGCIYQERWDCIFSYKGDSVEDYMNCQFNFMSDGGRDLWSIEHTTTGNSKITWGALYTVNDAGDQVTPQSCAESATPDPDMFNTVASDIYDGGFYINVGVVTIATMPPVQSTVASPFALAACYCPNYDYAMGSYCGEDSSTCCDDPEEYIQDIGVLYYWIMKVCDYANYATCDPPYMRVVPHQKFTVRVECPPSGCLTTFDNRIKFLDPAAANNYPAWNSRSGCRLTLAETPSAVWPEIDNSLSLDGGDRLDYKVWFDKQVKIALPLDSVLDVCYTNNYDDPDSWFKIGQIQTSSRFNFASVIEASSAVRALEYINHPGSVTLFAGSGISSATQNSLLTDGTTVNPFESNKWSGKAVVNIMSFDRLAIAGTDTIETMYQYHIAQPATFRGRMDFECQRELYNPDLLIGPESRQAAKTYIAQVGPTDTTVDTYLTYSGAAKDQLIQIEVAGIIAVCYCAMLNDQDECESTSYWLFAGLTTIKGPTQGQTWTLPIGIVTRLRVTGWGLSNDDRLRIVEASTDPKKCVENSNNPAGDTSFKVGCPAAENDCRDATTSENIVVTTQTAVSTGIFITSVVVSSSQTVLQFSDDVTGVLEVGDQITIDYDRLRIGAAVTEPAAMTLQEKVEAYKLSGTYEYQDDTDSHFIVPHKLSAVESGGVIDPTRMAIPVGWVIDPVFAFQDSQGYWMQRNKMKTEVELRGGAAAENLHVCWGVVGGGGAVTYYEKAGSLTFEDPYDRPMPSAMVSITTKQEGAVAPVVISFVTDSTRSEYASVWRLRGKTKLMLRFLDASDASGSLVPRLAEDFIPTQQTETTIIAQEEPGRFQDSEEQVTPLQHVCGKMFLELWANDQETGFPMPEGCTFTQKYRDMPNGDNPNFYREFEIHFPGGSGIKAGVEYMLVLNAEVKGITVNEHLVDIYTMCAGEEGCDIPYQVFEKGQVISLSETVPQATGTDPTFATNGFVIQGGEVSAAGPGPDEVLNLAQRNILQVRLKGGNGWQSIEASALIRIYLWPLTMWDIGPGACSAECIPYHINGGICQADGVGCDPEEVVVGSLKYNVIKITLPSDMNSITEDMMHTIKISGLTLPVDGYFPLRVGVQLTKPDDTAPIYTTSTNFLMKDPELGQTFGQLVLSDDPTGYGPKPFAGDTENTLYFRLRFGATLWNNGQASAATVQVALPDLYTCSVPGNPGERGIPEEGMSIFQITDDTTQYYKFPRAYLSDDSADGTWTYSPGDRICTYDLMMHMRIYAGQIVYVKVTADNPQNPKPKVPQVDNEWTVTIGSMGASMVAGVPYMMPEELFSITADEAEYFSFNAAVLSRLTEEVIQPMSFINSCCGIHPTSTVSRLYLHVFFKTVQSAGHGGFVVLDAPTNFDFHATCEPNNLEEVYYAYIGMDPAPRLKKLTNMGACVGIMRYPSEKYNRARFLVGGFIDADQYYGFRIYVTHPSFYDVAQHDNWFIWTQDPNGYFVEGSYSTVKFNPTQLSTQTLFYHRSYGMYEDDASAVVVSMGSYQAGADTTCYIDMISVDVDTADVQIRVTAPEGYVFSDAVDQGAFPAFVVTTNHSTTDWPSAPVKVTPNSIIFQNLLLNAGHSYGFGAQITTPAYDPVVSSNVWFIEFGFMNDLLPSRTRAAAIPAQPLRAVKDAFVGYNTNLMGYSSNRIEFRLTTVTALHESDGIVIKGATQQTAGFLLAEPCELVFIDGSDTMPSDVTCQALTSSQDSLPRITIKATDTPIPPGTYIFELVAVNPNQQSLEGAGEWEFGTWVDALYYGAVPAVDRALNAPGFLINVLMASAGLAPLSEQQKLDTGRNDRPGKPNHLIFTFRLSSDVVSVTDMKIKGPRGFVFFENCLEGLAYDSDEVFMDSTFPAQYTEWPEGTPVMDCVGYGREATITIATGLRKYADYVFRIAIASNPEGTPEYWNKWSIDYHAETCQPFESFPIHTFTQMSIEFTTTAKSSTMANVQRRENPVLFRFQPFNTIPGRPASLSKGGFIRITAPAGFEFVSENGECTIDLTELTTGGIEYLASDLLCEVTTPRTAQLYLQTLAKPIDSGKMYEMIMRVYNPSTTGVAQEWTFDSFADEAGTELDESSISDYPINNVLNIFSVINTQNVNIGVAKVPDIDFKLEFPDPLQDGQMVIITAPLGFEIRGAAVEQMQCNEFRYPATNPSPLPNSVPLCVCEGSGVSMQCTMTFYIDEGVDPAWPQNIELSFTIASQNPAITPPMTSNFWTIHHMLDDTIKSSDIHPSWQINPQLEDVNIDIANLAAMAAGSETDLRFQFTPISDANTIMIVALYPPLFSFGASTVDPPLLIDTASEGKTIILNNVDLRANVREEGLFIYNVLLGVGGGETRFTLITYKNELLDAPGGEKRDEKVDYTDGFRLPGKITTVSKKLESVYKTQPSMYPVKSLFPPRVLEDALAEFVLQFSQEVYAGEQLIVISQGFGAYTLKEPVLIIGTGQISNSPDIVSASEMRIELKPGRPPSEVALEKDTPYTLQFWCVPQAGENSWMFVTSDGGSYNTNTNDGLTASFSPVEMMQLSVLASNGRAPPYAEVPVTLSVQQGSAVVRELVIVAPPSFIFPPQCSTTNNCQAGQALSSTGRRTALITSPTGEPLTSLSALQIVVQTPELTPDDIAWYVEARGQGPGTTTGWGEGSGFPVQQMVAKVYYPGLSNLKGAQLTFVFQVSGDMGSQIDVIPPPVGYILSCSLEGALQQISLPGGRPDCVDDPLMLMLTETLPVGEYAFGIAVNLPPDTPDPSSNSFNLIIRDLQGKVVDARYQLPGLEIRDIAACCASLSWTLPEPGQKCYITVSITFEADTDQLKALLITFPPNSFVHDVQQPTDVQSLNRYFPVASGANWAQTSEPTMIKIFMDDTEDYTTIAAGTYPFQFPVLVPPDEMPQENIWHLSLCDTRDCGSIDHRNVLADFPMAGFAMGEQSPEEILDPTGHATRHASPNEALALGSAIAAAAAGTALSASG